MLKLEVGDIYQKPGTLEVRTINYADSAHTTYFDIGGDKKVIYTESFRRWLRRNKIEKPIGKYDFEKKKARAVK